jgi:Domain of unknown function (DUF4337)
MSDLADTVSEAVDRAEVDSEGGEGSNLNGLVALSVAIVATFTALCNVKGGNIGQAMQQAQASVVDGWAYFQAKGTKLNIAESARDMLRVQAETMPALTAEARALLARKIADYDAKIAVYDREKGDIKRDTEAHQREYDRLGIRDDQFDMAEATMSIAIALLGITALTKKRRLLYVAWMFAGFGAVLGIAGFAGWNIHPTFLARVLG